MFIVSIHLYNICIKYNKSNIFECFDSGGFRFRWISKPEPNETNGLVFHFYFSSVFLIFDSINNAKRIFQVAYGILTAISRAILIAI